MGTGEIAHYEQFLLFPLCFQKTGNVTADTSKPRLLWERVNALLEFYSKRFSPHAQKENKSQENQIFFAFIPFSTLYGTA